METNPFLVGRRLLEFAQADLIKGQRGNSRLRVAIYMMSGKEFTGDKLEEREGVWFIGSGANLVGFTPLGVSSYKLLD